ncbi:hypothetical protein [Capnocytophaga gingivalis]|uniref:hypothetical protein n=1 Tax=Capnocytophaga gingivalis TaxID=1017 RepID=UPI002B47E915|nr:hypothetical protein [Capnocytophaga gingivalis]
MNILHYFVFLYFLLEEFEEYDFYFQMNEVSPNYGILRVLSHKWLYTACSYYCLIGAIIRMPIKG